MFVTVKRYELLWERVLGDCKLLLCCHSLSPHSYRSGNWCLAILWLIDEPKLQALVYNILPPTIAIIGYTIDLRKLSTNWQFFAAAQIAVCLSQTTEIVSGVSFIKPSILLTPSQIKPKSFQSRRGTLFFSFSFFVRGRTRLMFMCVLRRCVASTVLFVPRPFEGRWGRRWTAARR